MDPVKWEGGGTQAAQHWHIFNFITFIYVMKWSTSLGAPGGTGSEWGT